MHEVTQDLDMEVLILEGSKRSRGVGSNTTTYGVGYNACVDSKGFICCKLNLQHVFKI
jgi:hypothetical protein